MKKEPLDTSRMEQLLIALSYKAVVDAGGKVTVKIADLEICHDRYVAIETNDEGTEVSFRLVSN